MACHKKMMAQKEIKAQKWKRVMAEKVYIMEERKKEMADNLNLMEKRKDKMVYKSIKFELDIRNTKSLEIC